MNEEQKKLFNNPPQLVDTINQERARGEIKDLLALDFGLTDTEIKWIDTLYLKKWLSKVDIKIIDDIYERRI